MFGHGSSQSWRARCQRDTIVHVDSPAGELTADNWSGRSYRIIANPPFFGACLCKECLTGSELVITRSQAAVRRGPDDHAVDVDAVDIVRGVGPRRRRHGRAEIAGLTRRTQVVGAGRMWHTGPMRSSWPATSLVRIC